MGFFHRELWVVFKDCTVSSCQRVHMYLNLDGGKPLLIFTFSARGITVKVNSTFGGPRDAGTYRFGRTAVYSVMSNYCGGSRDQLTGNPRVS